MTANSDSIHQIHESAQQHAMLKWYMDARHKYVWDVETISKYVPVLEWIVRWFLTMFNTSQEQFSPTGHWASPNIGLFPIHAESQEIFGYALYLANVKSPMVPSKRAFTEFADTYDGFFGKGEMAHLFGGFWLDRWAKSSPPSIVDLKQMYEGTKGVTRFATLVDKSLNRRRVVSKSTRYKVFQRDNFTCQTCGRRAPEVILHVDHIIPVSWELGWKTSDDIRDYQTLCEDCNLGKGNMSWILSVA